MNMKNDDMVLNVDTIAEIDDEIIDKFGIKSVVIGLKENNFAEELSINKYKKIREILDQVVKGIDNNLKDKEKFEIVYTRLANMISYDYEAAENDTEYSKENINRSRNLENGVLLGKCVCVGYAEILKQTLSLVDIESHLIVSQEDKDTSHAYNIVKIDGKYYNTDLTWDYGYIRAGISPEWCLKSDEDFSKGNTNLMHMPEKEVKWSCGESYINSYPEQKKKHFFKKVKLFVNYIKKKTQTIKEKHTNKENLLLAFHENCKDNNSTNNFKQRIKNECPTLQEQSENVRDFIINGEKSLDKR